MTAFRLIPMHLHSAFQMAMGLATMTAPFVLHFQPAGALVGVVIGAVLIGVALASVVDDTGHTAIPVSSVHAADYGLAIGLLGAAGVLAVAGDQVAGIAFAVLATAQFALNVTTRYSLRG